MTPNSNRKWYARWDVVGIVGLLLATGSIALSQYQVKQAEREALQTECRSKEFEVQELMAQQAGMRQRAEKLSAEVEDLRDQEREMSRHFGRATLYIEALNAELTVGKTVSSFASAMRKFKIDHGERAFETESPDSWVEYLSRAGYSSTLTDRQLLARSMMDWGLENDAGSLMVLTPIDEEVTKHLIHSLRDLSSQMAMRRDDNYFDGIQGIQDKDEYLAGSERNIREVRANIESTRSTLESAINDLRLAGVKLRQAEARLADLAC